MRTDTENDGNTTVLEFYNVPYETIVELLEYDVTYNVLKFFVNNKGVLSVKQKLLENEKMYIRVCVNTSIVLDKIIDVDSHINIMLKQIELKQANKENEEPEN